MNKNSQSIIAIAVGFILCISVFGYMIYSEETSTTPLSDILTRIGYYESQPYERDFLLDELREDNSNYDYIDDGVSGGGTTIQGWNNGKINILACSGDFTVREVQLLPSSSGVSGYGTISSIKVKTNLDGPSAFYAPSTCKASFALYKWEQLVPIQVDGRSYAKCGPSASTWTAWSYSPGLFKNDDMGLTFSNTNMQFEEEDAYHIIGTIEITIFTPNGLYIETATFTTNAFSTGNGGDSLQ